MPSRSRRSSLAIQIVAFLIFFIPFVIGESVHGSQTASAAWLDPIPPSLRERLVNKFQSYVEYERNCEYEKLHDLLHQPNSEFFRTMKEAYVIARRNSSTKIVNIRPLSSRYDRATEIYVIQAEVDTQENGELTRELRIIHATLFNGDWYLSDPYVTLDETSVLETLTTTDPILTNSPRKRQKPLP